MTSRRLILPNDFLHRNDHEPIDLNRRLHKRIKVAINFGRTPWEIPPAYDPNCGLPHNVRTGQRYRGINTLLLCDTYHTEGFRSKWWGTEEDWQSIGVTVKQDEVPTLIAHYLGDGMAIEERLVFNAHQVQGADHLRPTIKEVVHHDDADFGLMGMLMEYHNPIIRYDEGYEGLGTDFIGYVPPYPWDDFPGHERGDYIMMRSVEKCADKATHYSILLHELTHWAEVRTAWIHCMPVREFVAEMAMHVLGLELGIPFALDRYNRTHWAHHWARIFNQDDRFFLWATAQVDRVCFYLLEPILHRGPNFYHDPWCVEPPVNLLSGPDSMSFDPVI